MTNGFQELPGAKPLDERAKTIPGHVERIMQRDYSPVNEGFHILYDAAELLRRNSARIEALESRQRALERGLQRIADYGTPENLSQQSPDVSLEDMPTLVAGRCHAVMALVRDIARAALGDA